jgi:hypothetical protein
MKFYTTNKKRNRGIESILFFLTGIFIAIITGQLFRESSQDDNNWLFDILILIIVAIIIIMLKKPADFIEIYDDTMRIRSVKNKYKLKSYEVIEVNISDILIEIKRRDADPILIDCGDFDSSVEEIIGKMELFKKDSKE